MEEDGKKHKSGNMFNQHVSAHIVMLPRLDWHPANMHGNRIIKLQYIERPFWLNAPFCHDWPSLRMRSRYKKTSMSTPQESSGSSVRL